MPSCAYLKEKRIPSAFESPRPHESARTWDYLEERVRTMKDAKMNTGQIAEALGIPLEKANKIYASLTEI